MCAFWSRFLRREPKGFGAGLVVVVREACFFVVGSCEAHHPLLALKLSGKLKRNYR